MAAVQLVRLWAPTLVALAALSLLALLGPSALEAAAGTAAVVLLIAAGYRTAVTFRAVRAWGYAERDRDLLVRHGLLVRRLSIVPYGRIQFVDVTAGPLERAFDLATVTLHTASAASDARIPGLEPAEARRLRDRLAALGADRAAGL
ncbi:MAG TPA: PH domain-containing protein [Pilimelia sp.]|nr:PH domain-containing protein [Pilimelia sp.]